MHVLDYICLDDFLKFVSQLCLPLPPQHLLNLNFMAPYFCEHLTQKGPLKKTL